MENYSSLIRGTTILRRPQNLSQVRLGYPSDFKAVVQSQQKITYSPNASTASPLQSNEPNYSNLPLALDLPDFAPNSQPVDFTNVADLPTHLLSSGGKTGIIVENWEQKILFLDLLVDLRQYLQIKVNLVK